ncbi:MAG: hypothetical protein ACI867_002459, partial [Glaciecola sp.]
MSVPSPQHAMTAVGLAVGSVLLLAGPALAHPAFNPNRVTVGEVHQVDLIVPHGCTAAGGAPDAGEQTSPSTEIAMQATDDFSSLSGASTDGWTVASSDGEITWSDAGGSTTDPIILPVTIQLAEGRAPGETIYVTVLQTCAEGSMLWAAGPSQDGSPAVSLTVADPADPEGSVSEDIAPDHSQHGTPDAAMGDAEMGEHAMDDIAEHATDDDAEHDLDPRSSESGAVDLDGSTGLLTSETDDSSGARA